MSSDNQQLRHDNLLFKLIALRSGSAREHIHAVHTELARRLLLRRRAKTVKPGCDVHVFQPDPLQIIDELCLRQSAGDSTGPEVDVAARVLGKLHVERNVGQMEAAVGLQNPNDFGEPQLLLRNEVENAV